jgi:signal transduction histidine kinase
MTQKPTYEELEQRIRGLEKEAAARQQAEEAVRESEKRLYQEEMRMEILKFANNVALELMHELRTPLVCIGGFSRRISSRDYPQDKLKEHTRIIFEESIRLDNVLNKVVAHLKAAVQQL